MKTSRYTEAQIIAILRQAEGRVPVAELCREHCMSDASFCKWRAKYGNMDPSLISQIKAMEDENGRLKRMHADLSMQADLLKEALGKSNSAVSTPRDGRECGGATWGQHCAGLPGVWPQRDLLSLQLKDENEEIADLLIGLTRPARHGGGSAYAFCTCATSKVIHGTINAITASTLDWN